MRRAYIDIPEGQMHYRVAGSGDKNIILLHMSGSTGDEFEKTGDLLAERGWHAYAPDLLGFGGSDRPPHYYSLKDHAKTVISFMKSLGMTNAVLYGNLATANMAVRIAVEHPEAVTGLLLAHPLGTLDPAQYAKKRFLPEYTVITPQADGSHMAELWKRSLKYGEDAALCDQRCRCLHAAADLGETLHWALFEDTPLLEMAPKVQQKTVCVAYQRFGAPTYIQHVVSTLPNGVFDTYEDGSPYISRKNPETVVQMICKHFE